MNSKIIYTIIKALMKVGFISEIWLIVLDVLNKEKKIWVLSNYYAFLFVSLFRNLLHSTWQFAYVRTLWFDGCFIYMI